LGQRNEAKMAEARDWRRVEQALPLLTEMPAGLRSELTQVQFDEGEIIFRRGDRPRAMYAVLSGEARCESACKKGSDAILVQLIHSAPINLA
jgi:CRP-like cAMP-binding protein